MPYIRFFLFALVCAVGGPALAQTEREVIGGDLFIAGSGSPGDVQATRDLFAAGGSLTVAGEVAQDAHFAGFDIDVETDVADDVYAAGASVTVRANVGEDLTAAGFSVRLADAGEVAGNARLTGASVVVDGPVRGALLASGGEVVLNSEIGGDVRIFAGDLRFGSGARIAGDLRYAAPEEVDIPASVIDPARVRFERTERWEGVERATREWRGPEYPAFPGTSAILGALVVTIGFFVVLAAVALAIWPARIEALRQEALARPGRALLGGVLGLAVIFGLAPIAVMTILGIPLLPVILLALLAIWILGYALGVYILALRVWIGLGGSEPTMPGRLAVFAAGILIGALLNVIPFVGWVINFTLVLFGIGALAMPIFGALFSPRKQGAEPE